MVGTIALSRETSGRQSSFQEKNFRFKFATCDATLFRNIEGFQMWSWRKMEIIERTEERIETRECNSNSMAYGTRRFNVALTRALQ